MKTAHNLLLLLALGSMALGQSAAAPAGIGGTVPDNPSTAAILSDLNRLQMAAGQANLDIGHLRIEKWKVDSGFDQQAQANANALQRNLTSALPGLIDNFRAAPQDLTAGFKLYRNLNALYDVLASFTESAGAFGPRSDYEALARQLIVIDSVRHALGDNLENLTASAKTELAQLAGQVRTLQQQKAIADYDVGRFEDQVDESSDYDRRLANAMALVKADRLAGAGSAAAALVKSNPDRWEGYVLEATIDQKEKKLTAAKAAYQHALKLAPADDKAKIAQALHQIEPRAKE